MFENTRDFFVQNVLANFKDYIEGTEKLSAGRKTDLRLALNAATSLYHLREHMPSDYAKTRRELGEICPDYDLLGDIVNSFKHRNITKGRNPKVTSATSLQEYAVVTEYIDDEGPFHTAYKEIFVKTVDGDEKRLSEIIINIFNMWTHELNELGIIDVPEYVKTELPITRTNADGSAKLDLEIVAGEDFDQQILIQRYDYENKRIVPVDLTGHEFTGNIYKPSDEIVFTATSDATGEEQQVIVPLTEEQSYIYQSLHDDDAKQKYVNEVVSSSPIVHEFIRSLKQKESLNGKFRNFLRKWSTIICNKLKRCGT